ncbi:MAG: hypothetical protein M1828_003507 [Chrysothrix sp. TS-e1954]|nr:MAG: hypothetical protein M1828_003507 [Chrysothrix sp. TS-e1954]
MSNVKPTCAHRHRTEDEAKDETHRPIDISSAALLAQQKASGRNIKPLSAYPPYRTSEQAMNEVRMRPVYRSSTGIPSNAKPLLIPYGYRTEDEAAEEVLRNIRRRSAPTKGLTHANTDPGAETDDDWTEILTPTSTVAGDEMPELLSATGSPRAGPVLDVTADARSDVSAGTSDAVANMDMGRTKQPDHLNDVMADTHSEVPVNTDDAGKNEDIGDLDWPSIKAASQDAEVPDEDRSVVSADTNNAVKNEDIGGSDRASVGTFSSRTYAPAAGMNDILGIDHMVPSYEPSTKAADFDFRRRSSETWQALENLRRALHVPPETNFFSSRYGYSQDLLDQLRTFRERIDGTVRQASLEENGGMLDFDDGGMVPTEATYDNMLQTQSTPFQPDMSMGDAEAARDQSAGASSQDMVGDALPLPQSLPVPSASELNASTGFLAGNSPDDQQFWYDNTHSDGFGIYNDTGSFRDITCGASRLPVVDVPKRDFDLESEHEHADPPKESFLPVQTIRYKYDSAALPSRRRSADYQPTPAEHYSSVLGTSSSSLEYDNRTVSNAVESWAPIGKKKITTPSFPANASVADEEKGSLSSEYFKRFFAECPKPCARIQGLLWILEDKHEWTAAETKTYREEALGAELYFWLVVAPSRALPSTGRWPSRPFENIHVNAYVNLFDFIECCRQGRAIHPQFYDVHEFEKYTVATGKVFPMRALKCIPSETVEKLKAIGNLQDLPAPQDMTTGVADLKNHPTSGMTTNEQQPESRSRQSTLEMWWSNPAVGSSSNLQQGTPTPAEERNAEASSVKEPMKDFRHQVEEIDFVHQRRDFEESYAAKLAAWRSEVTNESRRKSLGLEMYDMDLQRYKAQQLELSSRAMEG